MSHRKYNYVGPDNIRDIALSQPAGTSIHSIDDLKLWLSSTTTEQTPDGNWIATFTVCENGTFRIAPRRSEHVACAQGGPVLSAGEITIHEEFSVLEISNQSTGFCPEPNSWPAVGAALDDIGITHPGRFTYPIVFRLCPKCNERNIVKDEWYYCGLCDGTLPEVWNFPNTNNAG